LCNAHNQRILINLEGRRSKIRRKISILINGLCPPKTLKRGEKERIKRVGSLA
jgi:hypothetical protein